ncbi:MAG: hypothetical protein HQL14_07565 [Candidatus Omnitrophica bacterium]|nr:hypothetical protein [Candidatus Omnitrophota bacterium]
MKIPINKILMTIARYEFLWGVLFPFVLWVFCFHDFFSGRIRFEVDAISYANHIGFYTDQLSKGIFPLWDPSWFSGAPYHFFLRRIGDVNPLLSLIVFLKWLGVASPVAYMIFLGGYYFLAMWAFYLITRFLLTDRFYAFAAYILLLFSSWGPELFYNYIIIIFVPVIWFFYFMLRFSTHPQRSSLLGICLSLGIIMTTYIPFYFLTVLTVFIFFYILFYSRQFLDAFKRSLLFMRGNKFFIVLCIIFLLVSCVPALVFYRESRAGEFALPGRHAGADTSSVVAVGLDSIASGDLVNHGYFDRLFSDHPHLLMGDIFIPYLFFVILLSTTLARVNKLVLFLLFNIMALTLISITSAAKIHHFLFTHILFFKFIRQIYYFFWLAILPMGILLSLTAFKSLLAGMDACRNKTGWLINIILCYIIFVIFLLKCGGNLGGAWISIFLSFLFFPIYLYFKKNFSRPVGFCLLFLSVFIQSAQVYGLLSDRLYNEQQQPVIHPDQSRQIPEKLQPLNLYYASQWFTVLVNHINPLVLDAYRSHPFVLYENVIPYEESSSFFNLLERIMAANANIAYVPKPETGPDVWQSKPDTLAVANINPIAAGQVSLVSADPNTIRLKTHLHARQFLVINDNFHSDWHAFINGRQTPLYRANVAFKGLWVPAGESDVLLRFSHPLRYAGHFMLIAIFWGTFVYLLVLIKSDKRIVKSDA